MKDESPTRPLALPPDVVQRINARLGGVNKAMGLRFVEATAERFVAELTVGAQHLQPYGLVHGGVLAGMIETLCSTGAAVNLFASGKAAVGLENTTSFLRAGRGGVLRCTARPLVRGRRTEVWEGEVRDEAGDLLATGRVRLLVLDQGAQVRGQIVGLQAGEDPEVRG